MPGVVAAFATRLALSWDGSYFLVDVLDQGKPVMLHRRPTMMLFQVPAWLGSLVTSNTRVLGFLFTLPYVLVPLVALGLSWLVVRGTRPALIVWPAIGIGLITLPGQAFFVSESVIAAQFVWPLVLALITGYRWNRWAFGSLVALLFLLHPMTSLVLGTAAAVGFVVGWRRPADRTWAWRQAIVLLVVAVARQILTSAGIDSEVPKRADIVAQWRHAVNGVPLAVVLLTTVGGAALLIGWRRRDRAAGSRPVHVALISWTGMLLLVAAGGLMIGWGSSTRAWWQALDYRSFVLVFALPLVLWALLDGVLPQGTGDPVPSEGAQPGRGAAHRGVRGGVQRGGVLGGPDRAERGVAPPRHPARPGREPGAPGVRARVDPARAPLRPAPLGHAGPRPARGGSHPRQGRRPRDPGLPAAGGEGLALGAADRAAPQAGAALVPLRARAGGHRRPARGGAARLDAVVAHPAGVRELGPR